MKAVRIYSYGDSEVLSYEESPLPEAEENEVVIRVIASAVNPFDLAVRNGYMAGWLNHSLPVILGCDVSGVIHSVGPGVTQFSVGQEVYARADYTRDGAYAEYVDVPISEVAVKPKSIDHIHAASIPHVALAAWRAIFETVNLAAGQTILIHAAAGGVGSIAVQLAKWRGARVIGTASTNNQDFLRELGVDQAIDYTTTPFEDVARDVDVVLDTMGGDTQQRSWGTLRPGGYLVSLVQPPDEETARAHGVHAALCGGYPPAGAILAEMAALIDAGIVRPVVSAVLPLNEIHEAHRMSATKHTRGKIVLSVSEQ